MKTMTAAQRQQYIAAGIASGKSQTELAEELGITQPTVSYYVARIRADDLALLRRAAIQDAVFALGQAYEPDGAYDPADDPRQEQAARHLIALIGEDAAYGVASGLMLLWNRWAIEGLGFEGPSNG